MSGLPCHVLAIVRNLYLNIRRLPFGSGDQQQHVPQNEGPDEDLNLVSTCNISDKGLHRVARWVILSAGERDIST